MDRVERRLERVSRAIGRTILQATLRQLETDRVEDVPARIHWQGHAYPTFSPRAKGAQE